MSEETENTVETKAIGSALVLKAEATGEVEAVIATLGVVDRDGDIIREGAIPDGAKVTMSSYNHDATPSLFGGPGGLPVGKGAIFTEGKKAVFRGRMFIDKSDRARETFGVLQEMGAQMEWSFGFHVIGAEVPSDEERKRGAARILTKLDVFEVSPVLVGAGVGTRTLAAKAADEAARAAAAAANAAEAAAQAAESAPANDDAAAQRTARESEQRAELERQAQRDAAESAERVAAQQEDELKAKRLQASIAESVDEYHRVQRTLKRMGVA